MFNNSTGSGRNARFDRFFDVLARNEKLCTEMEQELYETAWKKGFNPQNWLKWIRYYLYEKYREHGKMYLLEKNENTKVKFISSGKNNDDGTAFAELLIENLIQIHKIAEEDDGEMHGNGNISKGARSRHACRNDIRGKSSFTENSVL